MGGRDKLVQKARRNPGGQRIDDVLRLAGLAGFVATRITGGHFVLVHPRLAYTVGLAEPHGHGDSLVRSVYVRKLLSAIDDLAAQDASAEE